MFDIVKKQVYLLLLSFLLIFLLLPFQQNKVFAEDANIDEIKQNIENHSDKIKKLDEEIKVYSKQIEQVGSEAKSLQNTVKELDINQKKISTEIKKTETNIKKTDLVITELQQEIKDIEVRINSNELAIIKNINEIYRNDDTSLIESFLTEKSIAQIIDQYETSNQFRKSVGNKSKELLYLREELEDKKNNREGEKNKLLSLKEDLSDKNKILGINKKEKTTLLVSTKNKEIIYKNILAEKQAEKEKSEQELFKFESQLKRIIDPNSFPSAKKGILSWPLDNIVITQAFGKTIDSKKLYVSGTHNGIDFKASRGTPVKSVLGGVISGIGNTDEQKGCYSYGKWVLIKHPNGLSSLYAHFEFIKVSVGQSVGTGDIIGYSGQTGYATGPHLHLTLYASQGVEIQRYSSSKNCKNISIPISAQNAYLDPALYF